MPIFPIIFVIVFLLNSIFRQNFDFFDYDSVKNYTIIQEFQQGNFQNMFYHASPLFYWVMWLGNDVFSFWFLQVIFHSSAMAVWIYFFRCFMLYANFKIAYLALATHNANDTALRPKGIKTAYHSYVYVFMLSSCFLWGLGDYLAMETLSLLLSGLFFSAYFKTFFPNEGIVFLKKEKKVRSTTTISIKKTIFKISSDYDYNLLYFSAIIFGLLYTINYKAIMLLPLFLVLELASKHKRQHFILKKYLFAGFLALLPILFFVLLGGILGVSLWQYPKVIASTFLMSSGQKVAFGGQILGFSDFYFWWFLWYENSFVFVFVLMGLLFFSFLGLDYFIETIFFKKKKKYLFNTHKSFLYIRLVVLIFGIFVCLMSVLPTAPRGLVFVFPFFYLVGMFSISEILYFYQYYLMQKERKVKGFIFSNTFLRKYIEPSFKFLFMYVICKVYTFAFYLYAIIFLVFLGNNFFTKKEKNTYPEIADFLYKNNIKAIATSQSIQILPHAQKYGIKIYPLNHAQALQKLQTELKKSKQDTIKYVLLDDYCKILNTNKNFEHWYNTPKNQLISQWNLPSLNKILLYFEHAEFTKLSFAQTQKLYQNTHKTLQAKLLKL